MNPTLTNMIIKYDNCLNGLARIVIEFINAIEHD